MAVTPPQFEPQPAAAVAAQVRRRGIFLLSALFWAAVAGFAVILGSYYVIAVNYLLETAERLRRVTGYTAVQGQPDWLLILFVTLASALPLGLAALAWIAYRRHWDRRLSAVWPDGRAKRRFSGVRAIPVEAGQSELAEQVAYAQALLHSPAWSSEFQRITAAEGELRNLQASAVSPGNYRAVSAQILKRLERDVAERAIAVGLTVGISRSRLIDQLTILAAALELQLYVLARLGKRPSGRTWRELLKRCGASLFINTYLTREDALLASLIVKKLAFGLEAVAEASERLGEWVSEIDVDEMVSELGGKGAIADALGALTHAATMTTGLGLGIGSQGVRQIAIAVEAIGDRLLEGVIAAAFLYHHGMALASEVLAMDEAHRQAPEMQRSFSQGLRAAAETAGLILRRHVNDRRKAMRERRAQLREVAKQKMASIVTRPSKLRQDVPRS